MLREEGERERMIEIERKVENVKERGRKREGGGEC